MRRKKVFIPIFSIIIAISLFMALDIDADRLLTYRELFQTFTNPFQRDMDSDGLSDGEEIERSTNPVLSDTDGDGILDGDEVHTYGTNALLRDSDYDEVEDFEEIELGTNPTNPDTDGDGLFDCESFPLDSHRPALTMAISEVSLVKQDGNPFLRVSYEISVESSWVHDFTLVCNNLDWSDFHILVNGNEMPFDRAYERVLCRLKVESEMNVIVQYRSDFISKQLIAENSNFTLKEIAASLSHDKMSVESLQGDPYYSMQKAFDEYAKVISGFIFFREHLNELHRKFTSSENWYNWLYYSFYGAKSPEEVMDNLGKYIETSGTRALVEKVWIELKAFGATLPEFANIFVKYPDVCVKALAKVAYHHHNLDVWSLDELLEIVDIVGPFSTGEKLEKAIGMVTMSMEWIYVKLASEFFGWVNYTSPLEKIASYARGAQWYMESLSDIIALKNYYGVSFHRLIEPKLQYKPVGETGVAWWPTSVSSWPASNDVFLKPEATVFPLSEVRWIYDVTTLYGPKAGDELCLDVFLATESIVLNYLKENGFSVRYMPPTSEEKVQFQQIREISDYFTKQLARAHNLFLDSEILAEDIVTISTAFASFDAISDALKVLRRYGFATRFLEELNENTWVVTSL